jgi:hypothetical protein
VPEPDPPLEDLASYVEAGEPDVGDGRGHSAVRDAVARAAAKVGELVDGDGELAPASAVTTDGRDIDDVLVEHRVLGDQRVLLQAFDARWGAQPSRTRVALGTLQLRPADPVGNDPCSRVLRGHLHLRISFVRIPVELEVEPWHTYGLVLHLRPVRHSAGHIGWHRRWAWFATGHRLLDQMRRTMEDALQRSSTPPA